jgi:hypothetical protein
VIPPEHENPDEAVSLRATVIAGERHADDYQVIWRGLPIGRILRQLGVPVGPAYQRSILRVCGVLRLKLALMTPEQIKQSEEAGRRS